MVVAVIVVSPDSKERALTFERWWFWHWLSDDQCPVVGHGDDVVADASPGHLVGGVAYGLDDVILVETYESDHNMSEAASAAPQMRAGRIGVERGEFFSRFAFCHLRRVARFVTELVVAVDLGVAGVCRVGADDGGNTPGQERAVSAGVVVRHVLFVGLAFGVGDRMFGSACLVCEGGVSERRFRRNCLLGARWW